VPESSEEANMEKITAEWIDTARKTMQLAEDFQEELNAWAYANKIDAEWRKHADAARAAVNPPKYTSDFPNRGGSSWFYWDDPILTSEGLLYKGDREGDFEEFTVPFSFLNEDTRAEAIEWLYEQSREDRRKYDEKVRKEAAEKQAKKEAAEAAEYERLKKKFGGA
jgi:hypothetical protein